MAKYGNILTIFNSDDNKSTEVEIILANNQTVYLKLHNTYYIETNSKKNTSNVIRELNNLNIDFVFFHNHISDGSQIKSKGIDDSNINTINRILFQ
ncbi:MAG: hypothetical protein MUC49_21385 [Raineya sp.]|jgi:hypothetical protein|nr:hypothetical protein [Raineya sp.]